MATPRLKLIPSGGLRTFSKSKLLQIQKRKQSDPNAQKLAGSVNSFLQGSEYQLIQMMVGNNIWSGPPAKPQESGSLEFGLFGYWLNHGAPRNIQGLWTKLAGRLPATQFNETNIRNLLLAATTGLAGNDGTIYGFRKYEQMDPDWTGALFDYIDHYFLKHLAPFGLTPAKITAPGKERISIALLGDWGTGKYHKGPAASVIKAIANLKPDYIIHLGDVYYAGTHREEKARVLEMWPKKYKGKSLTLNSNHEMYNGAYGYFKKALANPIFKLQEKTSYFAINYGKWTVLGLDSAYWSTSPLISLGSICQADSTKLGANAQPQFIRDLGVSPQNVIVLTHHNAIEYDGSRIVRDEHGNNLWDQVKQALGGDPAAWYWGHVHNGIVYPCPTFTQNNSYCRCVGHGAIPFGNAWGLKDVPSARVKAYANTPNPKASPIRVMNGFAQLIIEASGKVTETFYDQDGKVSAWVKPFEYQLGAQSQKAVAVGAIR